MTAAADLDPPSGGGANRQNLLLLTQLRWIAAAGQVATILFVQGVLGVALPLGPMALVVALLLLLNAATLWRHRRGRPVTHAELLLQLLLDVAALTAQLAFSGGASNPFVMLFLLQIILGATLLEAWAAWTLVGVTSLGFLLLMGDGVALDLPLAAAGPTAPLHLRGSLLCFLLAAILLVFFIGKINGNLRVGDRRLADLRRQAVEEEHIVRLGLLASGAAHELGTPLATLSVILNDWRRMPQMAADGEIAQEIDDMQTQLDRCKGIVSGILMSSGEARGEALTRTSVAAFLDELVQDWQALRSPRRLDYRNGFRPDQPMLSDPALKQVIGSLFDNALEASPAWIGVTAERRAGALVLRIDDKGPGFAPEMLREFGKPYRSSKGRPGGGLGLYLVVNVMRKLGGTVQARNRESGGASVTLALPLDRLSPEGADGR